STEENNPQTEENTTTTGVNQNTTKSQQNIRKRGTNNPQPEENTTTAEQNAKESQVNQSTTTRGNITANLIEPPYENLLNLSSERTYRIYNHMTELPVMDKQEKEELLLLLNAITTPEKPYQHIQTAIIHSLAQTL